MRIRKILAGNFIEGERVAVNIDGDIIERVVRWCSYANDLCILYKGNKYFYCEF